MLEYNYLSSPEKLIEHQYRYFENELKNGNMINLGKILHESWLLKRGLDKSVSSLNLDQIYNTAINENDVNSKNEISKIMGFSDYSLFWKTRERILKNIMLLNNKYSLKNLSTLLVFGKILMVLRIIL